MKYRHGIDNKKRYTPDKSFWVWFILALFMIFISEEALGYDFEGEHWQSEFRWYMAPGCPKFLKDAVEEALEKHSPVSTRYAGKWSGVPSSDTLSVMYCGYDDVRANQLTLPTPGVQERTEATTAATARWSFYINSLKMRSCDVWFNSAYLEEYTDYVMTLALHEVVGHCHGMRHSTIRDSVMYWAATRPDMHIDDVAGLSDLYQICRDEPFVDTSGNKFIPVMDVEDLLIEVDDERFDEWLGVKLSAYQYANTLWPSGVTNIQESVCNE